MASTTTGDAPIEETLTPEALQAAFQGELGSSRLPFAYRLGLFLGAIATTLLPLIYVALTALAAYGTWAWTSYARPLLSAGFYGVMAYGVGLLACAFMVVFMIKPLFVNRAKQPAVFELDQKRHPLLAMFIASICAAVRAPAPRKVFIDCNVNASAGLRRGLWSFFGHDLVLTVGAPLLAGMSTRQLAGVLAHEFGHFSQGSAMRMSYLIRSINVWFARVVFERDAWDQALQSSAGGGFWAIELLKLLCRAMVWITRRILWGLMMLSHAIGMYLLRAMEYDADSYEARLAGSNVFAATSGRIRLLTAGRERAIGISTVTASEGRLCDDFPSLVDAMVERFPEATSQRILETELPRSRFDTHPPDEERIAAAEQMAAAGIMQLEIPARRLIADFDIFSQQITRFFYQYESLVDLKKMLLVPLDEYLQVIDEEAGFEKDAHDHLENIVSLDHLVLQNLEPRGPFASLEEGMSTIRNSRQRIAEQSAKMKASFEALAQQMKVASSADTNKRDVDKEVVRQSFEANEKKMDRLKSQIGKHILDVDAVLRTPGAETLFPDHDEYTRCRKLMSESVDVLLDITRQSELQPLMAAVRRGWVLVEELGTQYEQRRAEELVSCVEKSRAIVPRLQSSFHHIPYTLADNAQVETLRDYLMVGLPLFSNEVVADLNCAGHFLDRLSTCYARCMGRVGHVVRVVETSLPEA